MFDHGGGGEATIGTAQIRRYVLSRLRQTLDVGFINDGVFPADVRTHFPAIPMAGFIDDHRLRHAPRIVAPIEGKVCARAAGAIAEMGIAPDKPPGKPPCIGIEQQLVGVEAMAAFGLVGPVNAIAVELPGRNVVQIAMPDILTSLRQFDPLELAAALGVEQTKFDLLRVGREQREIGTPPVPACTEPSWRSS